VATLFVEEYVKNNKPNKYLIFNFLTYPIPNLDYVSYTRFNCVIITKPFRYLNYEDYVSAAYLTKYLDFVMATCCPTDYSFPVRIDKREKEAN